MEYYLQPQDDGMPARSSGPWVTEKLDYLERYINTFTAAMHGKPWRGMHYIDLFAGPGKCYVPKTRLTYLGSPLLALTAQYPFTGYYFVDLDSDNLSVLRQRCSASPVCGRVQCLAGDSNVLVHEIVERIAALDRPYRPGEWPSLNLAFLDPEGLELHWETVAALAQLNRMDLIIHYPQMGLTRYMCRAFTVDGNTNVDTFFGDHEWRDIYGESRDGVHHRLIAHYREKLLGLGYQEVFHDEEVGYEPLIRNTKRRTPLYRLLFASKHPLGHDFWQKITRRDVHGQTRLL